MTGSSWQCDVCHYMNSGVICTQCGNAPHSPQATGESQAQTVSMNQHAASVDARNGGVTYKIKPLVWSLVQVNSQEDAYFIHQASTPLGKWWANEVDGLWVARDGTTGKRYKTYDKAIAAAEANYLEEIRKALE